MANRQNTVRVTLYLDSNQFESALSRIQGRMTGAFNSIGGVAQNSIGPGVLGTSLWIAGFNAIQTAGIAAFRGISNQIAVGINYQTDLIGMANSFQGLLRLSYDEAFKLAQLSTKIYEQSSMGLPFQRLGQELRAAFGDDLLSALYDIKNPEGSIKRVAAILNDLQIVIGSTIGTTPFQQKSFISSLIGENFKKISRLEVYRNNPQLQRAIEKAIADFGGVALFDAATRQQRLGLLETIGKNSVSREVVESYKQSIAGYFEIFKIGLFGIQGIFSLSRDLIPQIEGSSLANSLTNLFKELFGSGGLFENTYPIIKGLFDPFLIGIKLIIDGVTNIVRPINMVLKALKPLAPTLYAATAALTTFTLIGIGQTIGNLTAKMLLGNLIKSGGGMVGGRLGLSVLAGGNFGFLSQLGAASLLANVKGLGGILRTFPSIGFRTITGGLQGVVSGFLGLNTSFLALAGNPMTWVIAAILGAIALAGFTIWKYWKPLSSFFSGFFEGLGESLKPVADFFNIIKESLVSIAEFAKPATDALGGFTKPIGEFFSFKQVESTGKERSFGKSAGMFAGEFLKNIATLGMYNLFKSVQMLKSNFADGNVFGGVEAILEEQKRKPRGSQLAIANSSEVVLNKAQQKRLVDAYEIDRQPIKFNGNSSKNFSYSPTINVSISNSSESGGNGDAIAEKVKQVLDQHWQKTVNSFYF